MMRMTALVVNGRTYERKRGRTINRWTYQPANGHPRVWVHRTSRLHHALEALAAAEEYAHEARALLIECNELIEAASAVVALSRTLPAGEDFFTTQTYAVMANAVLKIAGHPTTPHPPEAEG